MLVVKAVKHDVIIARLAQLVGHWTAEREVTCSPDLFSKECYELRKMFLKLKYPVKLIDSSFKRFHASQDQNQSRIKPVDSPVLIILPFKDQKSADSVRRELSDLGKKIGRVLQPVFTSRKMSENLKVTKTKPSLVNQQCVVYEFQCNSCDSNYIGGLHVTSSPPCWWT